MEWITFFLRGVVVQSSDAVRRAGLLRELRERYIRLLTEKQSSTKPLELINALFESPGLTVAAAGKRLGTTPKTAQLNIDKLVRAGILHEATGQSTHRVYVAQEIIDLTDMDLPS